MLVTSSWLTDIPLLLITVILLLHIYFSRKFSYWKTRGIFYVRPIPFFGNAFDAFTFKKSVAMWTKDIYDSVDEPFFGIYVFGQSYLFLKSPELIKHVLIKDFNHFTDRKVAAPKHDEVIANIMFIQKSPDWKRIRPLMTPVFTSGKLKGMFPIINSVGLDMKKYIRKNLGQLEIKELCAKYATDVIAKCAFAIQANSFEHEDADFRKIGRSFFDFTWRNVINQAAYFLYEDLANSLRLNLFDPRGLKYLTDIFWQAIKTREETNAKGHDLIDIIVDMRKNKSLCDELSFKGDKVVAQAVMFFTAGFETTSAAISFTLYELCIHTEIQDKLRAEIINSIKENNGVTYDSVQQMKYLDMCVLETLRKHNTLPFLDRKCNADYKIPGTDVVIERGIPIMIPTWGLHLDEKYFPEPNEYKPERFFDKSSYNVNGLYYLPFGEGPRNCIGERFAMLSTKLALVNILSEFIIERTLATPVPLEYSTKSLATQSNVGLPMRFKELH